MDKLSNPVDLEPLSLLTYTAIVELEADQKNSKAPLAVYPPVGVFGAAMQKARAEVVPGGGGLDGWE